MNDVLANLQYVIGIIASFVMIGLKKIPIVETNKEWLIPLIMVVICTAACYFNGVATWLTEGTTMALAICKLYDWLTANKAESKPQV